MNNMEIIPAVLTNDPQELDGWLRKVSESKKFQRVQIDFVDPMFALNQTIKPSEADLIPYLPIKFDAHLMVTQENVLFWTKTAEKIGFDRVIVQMESVAEPGEYNGLALDIHSPIEAIEKYLIKLKVVVLMGVEPGFGGQKRSTEVVRKAQELVRRRSERKLKFRICVDGGVEQEDVAELEMAGVDEVAVGVKRVLLWT